MQDQVLINKFREQGCRAYQAEFAAEFLRPDAAHYQLLAAPVGSGKFYVASRIVPYMLGHEMVRRILVLTPSALAQAWHASLAGTCGTVPNIVISRQSYRELVAETPVGESPWPQPIIAIAPIDTAKQSDIAESLAEVHWDLVIIDEAHRLSGPQRMAMLERLISGKAVGRLLLMTATPFPLFSPFVDKHEEPFTSLLPDLSITNWLAGLRDWDGGLIATRPVQWVTVEYRRGSDELAFLQILQDGLRQFATDRNSAFMSTMLLRRAESSIFAVEQSLRRLHRTLAVQPGITKGMEPVADTAEDSDDALVEEVAEKTSNVIWEDNHAARQFVESCLDSLEQVQSDEKLASVTKLLKELIVRPASKICMISSCLDSLSYLHSTVSDLGIAADLVSSGHTFSERHDIIDRFRQEGTLLLATDAVMEGIILPEVNHVIHIDLPWNPMRMMQRQGRFDRIGRSEPLAMYFLHDTSGALPFDQQLERVLAKVEELRRTGILSE